MKLLRRTVRLLSIIPVCLTQFANAAPSETPWYRVNQLNGGWTIPNLLVEVSGTYYNPDSCTWNGYMIDQSISGYQLFESMVLSAFMAGKEVSFTIDGCTSYWAKVIGVKVR